MSKTSVTIGEHFEGFIASEIATGRYKTASEVMRAALRLLEDRTEHQRAIIQALIEGEESGTSERTPEDIRRAVQERAKRDGII